MTSLLSLIIATEASSAPTTAALATIPAAAEVSNMSVARGAGMRGTDGGRGTGAEAVVSANAVKEFVVGWDDCSRGEDACSGSGDAGGCVDVMVD